MKKLTVLIFSVILLSCSFTYESEADTHGFFDGEFKDKLYMQDVPQVCGNAWTIQRYLDLHMFTKTSVAVARTGADQNGDPVYMVIVYNNKDKTQEIPVVVVPGSNEACMIYRVFDRKEFNEEE